MCYYTFNPLKNKNVKNKLIFTVLYQLTLKYCKLSKIKCVFHYPMWNNKFFIYNLIRIYNAYNFNKGFYYILVIEITRKLSY